MGREARCIARFGEAESEGKALLETDELLFRGEFRLKIPYAQITALSAEDGCLTVTYPEGTAGFDLGPEAAKWLDRIQNPPTLLDKLGVKPGMRVAVHALDNASLLDQLRERGAVLVTEAPVREADLVFLGAEVAADLLQLHELERVIRRDGGIWVVYPKGRKEITENGVIQAGRDAGFYDVKVCRFSESHTALKFVIPKDRRQPVAGANSRS